MSKSTELSNTIYDWLTLLGIKVQADYCTEQITSHTDYPAITAATDFLDEGFMTYQTVKADLNYVKEFNYPLLVHIKERGNEYLHILNNIKEAVFK